MGVETGQRGSADIAQLEAAIDASADIADKLSSLVREKTDASRQANG